MPDNWEEVSMEDQQLVTAPGACPGIMRLFTAILLAGIAMLASADEITKPFHYISVFGIQLIRIPEGDVRVDNSNREDDEKLTTPVHIKSFLMGRYPVTQLRWKSIMGDNPSHYKGARRPVENVSREDVQVFIHKLNHRLGKHFRLPTEMEWEYAAGSEMPGDFEGISGINLKNCFECDNRADADRTAPVGTGKPNTFGLYDMHGEIIEMVQGRTHERNENSHAESSNWESSDSSTDKLLGYSWGFKPGLFKSWFRDGFDRGYRGNLKGFRLVLDQ